MNYQILGGLMLLIPLVWVFYMAYREGIFTGFILALGVSILGTAWIFFAIGFLMGEFP